jgi:hypothetical protein
MNSLDTTNPAGRRQVFAGVLLTTLLLAGCSVEQPKTRCQTAKGAFSLKYTKVDGSGPCAELKGETAGVNSYWRVEGNDRSVTRGPVAIRNDEVGALLEQYGQSAESKLVAAVGGFATDDPGPDGFCDVTMASPAQLKLDPVPGTPAMGDAGATDPLPGVALTLEWSNVRFYVTAAQPGTMFTGRLKYSKAVDGQACTATYDVVGLWPAVHCEGEEMGPNGMPRGSGKPDQELCHPCADPSKGRASGSGISPTLDITCDAETLACIPKSAPPSLLPAPISCGQAQ